MAFLRKKEENIMKPPSEFAHTLVLRIVNITILGVCVFFFLAALFFVYLWVYRPIDDGSFTPFTPETFLTEAIDFSRLERVRDAWQKKLHPPALSEINDPFFVSSTPHNR